ncbi:hypothetical protein AWC38_SpisGene21218 [Stylophora pistillata]|uniref:Ubiquitin-like domain-containing protein n=1 Tax=Stylophora pistillata TaxID=50429 RepID=A0A2B4RCU1_STYPI|nr:hypothetical protein AWC38_SpisGene21218 [Stylophora pistillata]
MLKIQVGMLCDLCKTRKLRREFPSDTVTDKCDHAPLHCLRHVSGFIQLNIKSNISDFLVSKQCVTRYVEKHQKCSQCPQAVKTCNPRYCEYLETLENLFPKYSAPAATTENVEAISLVGNETISVVMLGGDSTVVAFRPSMTIQDLKNYVQTRLGPAPQKQRLLYKEKELKKKTFSSRILESYHENFKPLLILISEKSRSMICDLCKTRKLRREFPSDTVTDKCDHAPLHCLRCVTKYVEKYHKCSQCLQAVKTSDPRYCEYLETLENLFPKYSAPAATTENVEAISDGNETISVVMLGGDSTVVAFRPSMTIQDLKNYVQTRLGPAPQKQRLLYKEKELKTHSVFDLFWGYPSSGRDYLDASVLIYSGSFPLGIVDYSQTAFSGISHSGDVMDDGNRLGHHTIRVQLKSLPSNINKLFFTLSAWSSPNISKYPNPSLRFFDAKEPNKQLCSDQMGHAAHSQAVIMCSLSKIDGVWKVFSLRTLSAGNANNYSPLQQTIGGIVAQGLC